MSISEIIAHVRDAEAQAARPSGSAKLIAVSKQQPNEKVAAVLADGHRLFGENRVQEALGKWPNWRAEYPDTQLHLIGPLQSNKARQAMELFDAIHTLDRPKLANGIARIAQELGACPKLFIQVNTGAEPQKAGVLPKAADAFITECRVLDLPIIGLMCIPPADEPAQPHFALLAKIALRNDLAELSMGMSSDYVEAIAAGATYVRVGSAIFGDRNSR